MLRLRRPVAISEELKQERETIIRFDETDDLATFYTASPSVATYWKRQGLNVQVVRQGHDGIPTGWEAKAPQAHVTIRRSITFSEKSLQARRNRGKALAGKEVVGSTDTTPPSEG